ncbi:MAG: aspartate carbamoyltransferase, partial [Chloroflexota bacterium]|nr:aspartate carbamoyltransferase [Chloroflexota bacterium]
MSLKNRSVTIIEDLSNEEIEQVFCVADRMLESIKGQTELCAGQIMATLFYEPSTRTRLSFEAAMNRLGGRVISVSDAQTSSHAKGESLADTARVVGSYVDIMVIRHPSEGSPRIAADYAGVPVVNAGDGTHEHPTQTLCDLYTLRREKGHIKGLTVALWGDLKYGRTVHSLAYGLARFGARIVALADEGMELPEYVTARLLNEYSCHVIQGKASDLDRIVQQVDAVCLNPPSSKQLPLTAQYSGDESGHKDDRDSATGQIDVLYLTRLQKERQFSSEGAAKVRYKTIDHQFMKRAEFSDTLLMHPLPRVGELSCELDTDPRSIYFKQASFGVPIRMAL